MSTTATTIPHPAAPSLSWLQRSARGKMLDWLATADGGVVRFSDSHQQHVLGTTAEDGLQASLNVREPDFYSQLATGGSLGFAESYLRNQWQTDDLTTLLRILYRNDRQASGDTSWIAKLTRRAARYSHQLASNTLRGSRRNIAAHYDLSNEFFDLFLDSTGMYSSAYFAEDSFSLREASEAKLQRICEKLDLQPRDHVLEIGTGWGGFALHAVQNHGVRLTTTTISSAQYQKAGQRFEAAGIADRVELLDSDYRDLVGRYDKLVSIEMIEAVGERFLKTYFERCGSLLKPGGRFVLQGIVMPESRYDAYRQGVDFIQKYIFPGGFLPSVAAMQQAVGQTTDLRLHTVEDLSPHYARTLHAWRQRFMRRLDDVRRLGFDDRFIRMWEYYLCYCEAAFSEQAVRVVQVVWDKPKR
ncbi:class I SAM-dependent methyltransferase [Rosistilla oblonga]|uniref:class I SAM-dependent methyltransferase n=1 Tax=Rosistilla oblonga TaxID=2527990 RepID=UPI003A9757CD